MVGPSKPASPVGAGAAAGAAAGSAAAAGRSGGRSSRSFLRLHLAAQIRQLFFQRVDTAGKIGRGLSLSQSSIPGAANNSETYRKN